MIITQKSYYEIDGEQYPRVTNILQVIDKPGLARWRGRLGNVEADRVSKEGSDMGTRFHEVAADVNRGTHQAMRGWQPPGDLREMAFNYVDWLHKHVASIQSVERTVHSRVRRYAGTLDVLGTIRGDSSPSIIDIKTSNNPSVDWPLQLAAYKMAIEEEEDIEIARRLIVRIPKDGSPVQVYEYKDHQQDAEMWLHALNLWNWTQKDKERHKDALIVGGL